LKNDNPAPDAQLVALQCDLKCLQRDTRAQIAKMQSEMRERIDEILKNFNSTLVDVLKNFNSTLVDLEEKIQKLKQGNKTFGEQTNALPAAVVIHVREDSNQ
jgi:predicted nuclease with TOPRIM domain